MAFMKQIEEREIYFTNHALDRWWERCQENELHGRNESLDLLRQRLSGADYVNSVPEWSQVNDHHRASAKGFVKIDDESGFVIKQNPNGDRVAVTFLDRLPND